jgi:tyrosinase
MEVNRMVVTRVNILSDDSRRDQFIRGVKLLKGEVLRPGWPNTYDLFVIWHYFAMNTFTPPGQQERNAAHMGPVFLPWHRWMLIILENHLQRVLNDDSFGLPYWDWAKDGELSVSQQKTAPIWSDNCMGGTGNPVTTGPFVQGLWKINVREDINGNLVRTNGSLLRSFGDRLEMLPTEAEVQTALNRGRPNVVYDAEPWDMNSISFRNELEGWMNIPPSRLHNAVHVWVGGDMLLGTSPNDPVFYLNHCNVDRIWAGWMKEFNEPEYLPRDNESNDLQGHRLNDLMHSIEEDDLFDPLYHGRSRPIDFLDPSAKYVYDTIEFDKL